MDYESILNPDQLKPVTDTEGQLLVLAGAGSGKTRVLTYRIAYLMDRLGVPAYNILAITFTNKAAAEMKERIQKVSGYQDVWVSTFHSLCSRILRYDITYLNDENNARVYNKNFTIYTEHESMRLLKRILKEGGYEEKGLENEIRWHISLAKNRGLGPDQYRERCRDERVHLICNLYTKYEEELARANALDFDDLLLKTIQLFVKNEEVLKKYQNRFRYIHVDEFQDTNKIQYILTRMLADGWKNLFVVGDDDQCIYTWRGAEVGNILNFAKDFPACKVYKLEQNYRSTQNILDCSNAIIVNNAMRTGKKLWTESEKGQKVIYQQSHDDREEADWVLREMTLLMRNHQYQLSDFAILTRVNSLSRAFEERLSLYGMQYKVYGGFKFFDRKEVKDFLAYLRIISNPKDADALRRILNFPKRGIGETSVAKLAAFCVQHGIDLIDGIFDIQKNTALGKAALTKMDGFRILLLDLIKNCAVLPFEEFVDYLYDAVGFDTAFDIANPEEASKRLNVGELITSIKEFCKDNPDATIDEYLQSVSLFSDTDEADEGSYVTLATIHAVKGLEFKCVFIVGLEEGIFPLMRAKDNPEEMEEERRIMYVAATRARERLYLTGASQRYRFGKIEQNAVSRFVKEAGFETKATRKVREEFTPRQAPLYTPKTANLLESSFAAKTVSEKDITAFLVGVRVYHKTFGEGIITERFGDNAKIMFEKLGVKQFNLKIAPVVLAKTQ